MALSLPNLRQLERLAINNSPFLLTAVGVLGVVGTAVATHRAALKGRETLLAADAKLVAQTAPGEEAEVLTNKEIIVLVGTHYIPPVLIGAATITAIVMANRISTKRTAAALAAYALTEKKASEYRDKVVEKLGVKDERTLRDELIQKDINENPPKRELVIVSGDGGVLCHDQFSGRYFRCRAEVLKRAENDLNRQMIHDQYATLSDFYHMIGLDPTNGSEDLGWNFTQIFQLDISAVLVDQDTPCLSFRFDPNPVPGFDQNLKHPLR